MLEDDAHEVAGTHDPSVVTAVVKDSTSLWQCLRIRPRCVARSLLGAGPFSCRVSFNSAGERFILCLAPLVERFVCVRRHTGRIQAHA